MQRPAAIATALTLAFAPASYGRYSIERETNPATITDGSRDRSLPGKARRRARQRRHNITVTLELVDNFTPAITRLKD